MVAPKVGPSEKGPAVKKIQMYVLNRKVPAILYQTLRDSEFREFPDRVPTQAMTVEALVAKTPESKLEGMYMIRVP
jgi:hypothetical protein